MGEVWQAEDRALRRPVAIKIVPADPSAGPELARRLRNEALTAAQLQHPGITVVHDIGGHEGDSYLVMELLDGQNLGEILASRPGGLPPATVVTLMTGVADALDYAHRKGVVHRDIKPENVMLLNDGTGTTVKICDFGVALLADVTRLTTSGVPGTPLFVAPELFKGEPADARSDLYAFGITLHALLTGEPPFTGPSLAAVMYQHLAAPPPRMSKTRPELGGDLDDLVQQLLAKNPADRPATAGQVRDRLRAIPGGAAVPGGQQKGMARTATITRAGVPLSRLPGTPARRHELAEHERPVLCVAFGPDGRSVASVTGGRARLWDAATGELLRKFPRFEYAHSVAISPAGHTMVTGAVGMVRVWGLTRQSRSAKRAFLSDMGKVCCVAFRRDGHTVACAGIKGNAIVLFDARTATQLRALAGHPGIVRSLAFSPDGRILASTGGGEHGFEALRLWDPSTGERLHQVTGITKGVYATTFSPDGTRVATGDDDERIRVYDVTAGQQISEIAGHLGSVHAVAYSPDGHFLASAGYDQVIRLWDPDTGRLLHELDGHNGIVRTLAFAPDGRMLVSGADDRLVIIWDLGG
jgi:hypothetical protein